MPNAVPSTTFPVLRATPRSFVSASIERGTSPPWRRARSCAVVWIDFALLRKKPVGLTSASTSPVWAARLGEHAVDDAVDEPDVAVDDPGLHALHGVLADHALRPRELDARELRRVLEERLARDPDPGGDRAAQVFALRRHAVEGRR